jgi:hypothetical protein
METQVVVTYLLGLISAALALGSFRLVVGDRDQKRPVLAISEIRVAHSGQLDLGVSNCGDAVAVDVEVRAAGPVGAAVFYIEAIAAKGLATITAFYPVSASVELDVRYTDVRGRCFRSRRTVQLSTAQMICRGGKVEHDKVQYRNVRAWLRS